MPKNNSKARREWRKKRAEEVRIEDPAERILKAIFGAPSETADDKRPGTEFGK